MEAFQWAELALGVAGFGVTWTIGVIGLTRTVENIKTDTTTKIEAARIDRDKVLADARNDHDRALESLRSEVMALQKERDRNFGDTGIALRQKITDVEKEMHQIEIWGRDHYAVKDDISAIMAEIRSMRSENKADFTALSTKIDSHRLHQGN